METIELKQKIHSLIDNFEDEIVLENIFQVLHVGQSLDIIDELSTSQKARLQQSLLQAKNQQGISHDAMKTTIQSRFVK
jgi:hypothetical protein